MTIYLVGGPPHDGLDAMWDAFVASACVRGNRFTVALFSDGSNATEYLDDYFAPIIRRFPEADIDPLWLLQEPAATTSDSPSETAPAGLIVGDGSIPEICAALATKFPKWASYVRRGTGY
ncbi:MAG: hypothetical protein LBJ43_03345, partial [Propionibacteriaceae bacterium]|nr:hypothetical protein [Propionibacteriaceae bacterium]